MKGIVIGSMLAAIIWLAVFLIGGVPLIAAVLIASIVTLLAMIWRTG